MFSRFISLFYFLVLSASTFSQAPNQRFLDSLENAIGKQPDSKEKCKDLYTLTQAYCAVDFKKALYFSEEAEKVARHIHYEQGLANAFTIQGVIWINLGDNDKAIGCIDSSIVYHKMVKSDLGLATSYGNLAVLYYQMGKYDKALESNLQCLKIAEKLNNKRGMAQAISNIANIDYMQGDYEKAVQGYRQALDICTEIKNRQGQANAMLNIAAVYEKQKNTDLSENLYKRSLLIYDSLKDEQGMASACLGLGTLFKGKGDYEKALDMLLKALSLFEKTGNMNMRTEALGYIGGIYLKNGNFEKSIEYNEQFLKEAGKMRAKPYQKDAMESLAEAYAAMGNFARAYGYQMLLSRIKDTLYNEERLAQMAEMKIKYETEKKEQENNTLQQKARIYDLQLSLLFGSAVLLLLVASFALLYLRQNKLAAKQKTVELEQKVLRSQMNPHFLFNSLIAIQSFIYRNDPKTAGDYLSDFARLMRLILEYSREEMIPLEKEIKTLELYLKLQQLRFDNSFDFNIEVDESIRNSSVAIPPMLAQPFIENSVEHGISKIERQGMINVRFSQQDDFLKIVVTDNGVGITKAMENKKDKGHKSLATTITLERLEILNRGSKKKISLNFGDIKNPDGSIGGTKIEFGVPFKRL